jgi:hypothetical protein
MCNGELPSPRHQRWCSRECSDAFWRNHLWAMARGAALMRDNHRCVRCKRTEGEGHYGRRGLPLRIQVHHITPLHTIRHTVETHWWKVGERVRHSDSGCWHHLDGLEVLCDDHHIEAHHPRVPVLSFDQLDFAELLK